MKTILKISAVAVLLLAVTAPAQAQRKLPLGAYLKSAKIDILSGDLSRYVEAEAMLDSLFMHYGPHAEGLFLMNQMMVDRLGKAVRQDSITYWVDRMVAYQDSLKLCCSNDKIKKKHREDCDEYIAKADSTGVKFWREYYNLSIETLKRIETALTDQQNATDSANAAFFQTKIDRLADTSQFALNIARTIDSTDYRVYYAAGTLFDRLGEYQKAIDWLLKGREYADEAELANLYYQVAYFYIQDDNYCDAATYFRKYVDMKPDTEKTTDDVGVMNNLVICYNNCQIFDSARAINRRILEIDPDNADALTGIGRYFNELARWANDSANSYRDTDEAQMHEWREIRKMRLDSSKVFFQKAFELKPNDKFAAQEYGVVCAILEDFDGAKTAFYRLTELDPGESDHWTSLGDIYLSTSNLDSAMVAYEKAVEIDPDNRMVWQQLADLYDNAGKKSKAAEARKKLDQM